MSTKHCIPCEGKIEPVKGQEISFRLMGLPGWRSYDDHHISKIFNFGDFKSALEFTNEIGKIAEAENHHPEIFLTWGRVEVKIYTHSVNGLTENDFILAELIDGIDKK